MALIKLHEYTSHYAIILSIIIVNSKGLNLKLRHRQSYYKKKTVKKEEYKSLSATCLSSVKKKKNKKKSISKVHVDKPIKLL